MKFISKFLGCQLCALYSKRHETFSSDKEGALNDIKHQSDLNVACLYYECISDRHQSGIFILSKFVLSFTRYMLLTAIKTT